MPAAVSPSERLEIIATAHGREGSRSDKSEDLPLLIQTFDTRGQVSNAFDMFLNLMISLCCAVFADDTLDVATVSAQKNAAMETLSPVQSVSGAKAETMGMTGLHEALHLFSGISIKDYGGIGGLKTVSVRNMGASHTAIVYDGIAVSDAQNGQTDISRFNMDEVHSISMSIGLDNDIFCSARHLSSAGVLYINSIAPPIGSGNMETSVRMTAGSFGTFNPRISLRKGIGKRYGIGLSATGTISQGNYPFVLHNGNKTTKGTRDNSDVRSAGGEAQFHADWGTQGRLKAIVNCHFSERGLPGSVILYTNKSYERLWDRSIISNIMYDREIDGTWKFHADVGVNSSHNRHLDTAPIYSAPQDSKYRQNEYTSAVRALYNNGNSWTLVAAEDCFVNTLDSNIPECPFPIRTTSITAVSVQYDKARLHIRASAAATAMLEKLKDGTSSDRFRISPAIGLNWNLAEGMHLRASYKEGFRMPTFNDLYYARVGNRGLKPEIARQLNIGATYENIHDRWWTSGTIDLYFNHLKDKITAIPTMFIWKMRNIGKAIMYGTDISIAGGWRLNSNINLMWNGNYSLQYALDVTDPKAKNYRHQIPYTPRHYGNCHITVQSTWIDLTFKTCIVGKRYAQSQNIPANEMEEYADCSISAGHSFEFGRNDSYRIRLSIDIMNLSNGNYEIINWYPMPGRHLRFTLKFNHLHIKR